MTLTRTVPLLKGTLAKRTKLSLQPNFAKPARPAGGEPFNPSLPNAGLRDSANMMDKLTEYKNRQCLKGGHKTSGCQWLFEHSSTHQLSVFVDKNTARTPKRFIPPKLLAVIIPKSCDYYF
jgi:hypothetical protein